MLKRPLAPSFAIFGWFVLVWTLLSHASTAQFVWSIGGQVSKWLDAHAWAGFLFGLLLLTLAVLWPVLRPLVPEWLRIPKTVGERPNAVEGQFEDRVRPLELATPMIGSKQREHGESIRTLTSALENRARVLEVSLQNSENTLTASLNALSEQIGQIKRVQDELVGSQSDMVGNLTAFMKTSGDGIKTISGNLHDLQEDRIKLITKVPEIESRVTAVNVKLVS